MKRTAYLCFACIISLLICSCGNSFPPSAESGAGSSSAAVTGAITETSPQSDPETFDFSSAGNKNSVLVTGEDILDLFRQAREYCEKYTVIRGKILSNSYEGTGWTGSNPLLPAGYVDETVKPDRGCAALFNQGKYGELSSEQTVKCVDDIMTVMMMNITSFCDPGIIFSEYPSFVSLSSPDYMGTKHVFGVRFAVLLNAQSADVNKADIISGYDKAVVKIPETRLSGDAGGWLGTLSIYCEGQRKAVFPTNRITAAVKAAAAAERSNDGQQEYLDLRNVQKEKQRYVTEEDITALLEKSKQDYLDHNAVFGDVVDNSYRNWSTKTGYTDKQAASYRTLYVNTNREYKKYIASGEFDRLTKRQLAEYVHSVLIIFMMNATVKFDKRIIFSEAISPVRTGSSPGTAYAIQLYNDSVTGEPSNILKAKNVQVRYVFFCTELVISEGTASQGSSPDGRYFGIPI